MPSTPRKSKETPARLQLSPTGYARVKDAFRLFDSSPAPQEPAGGFGNDILVEDHALDYLPPEHYHAYAGTIAHALIDSTPRRLRRLENNESIGNLFDELAQGTNRAFISRSPTENSEVTAETPFGAAFGRLGETSDNDSDSDAGSGVPDSEGDPNDSYEDEDDDIDQDEIGSDDENDSESDFNDGLEGGSDDGLDEDYAPSRRPTAASSRAIRRGTRAPRAPLSPNKSVANIPATSTSSRKRKGNTSSGRPSKIFKGNPDMSLKEVAQVLRQITRKAVAVAEFIKNQTPVQDKATKKYICFWDDKCGQMSASAGECRRHVFQHSKLSATLCLACGIAICRKDALHRHFRNKSYPRCQAIHDERADKAGLPRIFEVHKPTKEFPVTKFEAAADRLENLGKPAVKVETSRR